MRRYILFIFCISIFAFQFVSDVNAVARLATGCTKQTGTSVAGTGLDGSNCDSQLVCGDSGVCAYPTEVGCVGTGGMGNSGCGIGQKCMSDNGANAPAGQGGVCQSAGGGSAENNAIGDILCNTYKIATGKVGRGIIVVVLFVTGISFYLGKVQWGTIVAIVIGAGLCFGGPAIVSVMVGKNFLC